MFRFSCLGYVVHVTTAQSLWDHLGYDNQPIKRRLDARQGPRASNAERKFNSDIFSVVHVMKLQTVPFTWNRKKIPIIFALYPGIGQYQTSG